MVYVRRIFYDAYVKEPSRAHTLKEWDMEQERRRAERLLQGPPNGCSKCKCQIDGIVYLYQRKRYHAICMSIVYEQAKEKGTWNPRVPFAANGYIVGFGQA